MLPAAPGRPSIASEPTDSEPGKTGVVSGTAPRRPRSLAAEELGFVRKDPVRWFHPVELGRAGVRTVLADLFGAYADRRELQAALHPLSSLPEHDYAGDAGSELWLDFVADIGDGFDATYAVASQLARRELPLHRASPSEAASEALPTERGSILIMGGDEVYPVATREEYQHRTVGPYRAALPWVTDERRAPHLFAIPGNHDWYDGLTAFLRQFTQQRWIGGWKTQQRRSYFALKLPQRYWLWGIDIQLSADIDGAQLEYFRAQAKKLAPHDRIILCTAEPSWVKDFGKAKSVGYTNLLYLMREIESAAAEPGAEVVLIITGDSHHYSRYVEDCSSSAGAARSRLYLTAGGGGAFLHGTHTLPERLTLPGLGGREARTELSLAATYPARSASEAQLRAVWKFPLHHKSFALFWSCLWALLALVLTSAAATAEGAFDLDTTLFRRLAQDGPRSVLHERATLMLVVLGSLLTWTAGRLAFRRSLGKLKGLLRLPFDLLPWLASVVGLVALLTVAEAASVPPANAAAPLADLWQAVLRSPASLIMLLLLIVGSGVYVNHENKVAKYALGSCHALVHVLSWLEVAVIVVSVSLPLEHTVLAPALPAVWLLASAAISGGASAVIFALFLWFAGRYLPAQLNDVFSALGSPDYKNFLRLHISASGRLTLYPIGIPFVPRRWAVARADAGEEASWIEPAPDQRLEAVLIEGPLVLSERQLGQSWSVPSAEASGAPAAQ